jgi:putative GTP pyrophosphokinase
LTPTVDGAFAAELDRFVMIHRFAIDEITTKINILRDEFHHLHDNNPIEHVRARLKTPASIIAKARRRGYAMSTETIRRHIHDVAGVRVVCSFVSDVYSIFDIFLRQSDITVVDIEDYIARPKPNGYQSLHATVQIPVFLSTGTEHLHVEMQFRTIAMDFWASLEHKIYYKYGREVPLALRAELDEAAATATQLDERMQRLHREVIAIGDGVDTPPPAKC